jgi:hypothetical protein
MKKQLNIEQAEILIEKYYEGLTTSFEEQLLREFLSQDSIPVRFEAEKVLFDFFDTEKTIVHASTLDILAEAKVKPTKGLLLNFAPFLKWTLAAAVVISAIFIIQSRFSNASQNFAYVNGVRLTDPQELRRLAKVSLHDININANEVQSTFDHLNTNELIASQLENFPDF